MTKHTVYIPEPIGKAGLAILQAECRCPAWRLWSIVLTLCCLILDSSADGARRRRSRTYCSPNVPAARGNVINSDIKKSDAGKNKLQHPVAKEGNALAGDLPPVPKTETAEIVQPDYRKWESVKVGMSVAEVGKILGTPLEQSPFVNLKLLDDPTYRHRWSYGKIDSHSPAAPNVAYFVIHFTRGAVVEKTDPFETPLSKDGRPTIPKVVVPRDNEIFFHYPRFLDFRWLPSSGEYPMSYEVEVEHFMYVGDSKRIVQRCRQYDQLKTNIPHAASAFSSMGTGRWRVRAINRLGKSEWTPYYKFEFRQ